MLYNTVISHVPRSHSPMYRSFFDVWMSTGPTKNVRNNEPWRRTISWKLNVKITIKTSFYIANNKYDLFTLNYSIGSRFARSYLYLYTFQCICLNLQFNIVLRASTAMGPHYFSDFFTAADALCEKKTKKRCDIYIIGSAGLPPVRKARKTHSLDARNKTWCRGAR